MRELLDVWSYARINGAAMQGARISSENRKARTKAATEEATPDVLGLVAVGLTESRIAAIHAGLRIVAGMDSDYARELNGVGYSKMDVAIGHSLAERAFLTPRQAALGLKLVARYRRQIPGDVVAACGK